MLVGLAWGVLSRARPAVATLVCCGMVLEFVLMFWPHWWLVYHDPLIIDPNADGPRTDWVVMLNEALGRAEGIFVAGAVLLQAALAWLLLRWVRRPAAPTAEGPT